MLGYFCAPYPDELLYSVCARLSARLAFPRAQHTLAELFGTPNAMIGVDLPSYLRHFIGVIPHGHGYTADQFIERHTLVPFYEPFLDQRRAATIRARMKARGRQGFQFLLGPKGQNLQKPDRLRYCPQCVREDREQYGECYWHRVHQVPGVIVCPHHGMWLDTSEAPARDLRACHVFRPAEREIRPGLPRPLMPKESGSTALLAFAQNARWLLQHPQAADGEGVRQRYLAILAERGLATYRGHVQVSRLQKAFLRSYPESVLEQLEGPNGGLQSGLAVSALVHRSRTSRSPIHHLMFIHFLGYTAETFWRIPRETEYFGKGPWPCLNHAASHYGELMIDACKIQMSPTDGRPVGTFHCRCGFDYSRVGPDWSPMMRGRMGRVVTYGPVWERKLRTLWTTSGFAVETIARRLGVTPPTLRSQVRQQGLPMRRLDARARWIAPSGVRWRHPQTVYAPVEVEDRRRRWLRLRVTRRPSPAALRERRRLSTWLQRHDRRWLKAHPASRGPSLFGGKRMQIDWARRDRQLARLVESTVERLMAQSGKPLFLSRTQIIRQTGQQRMIAPHVARLPETQRVLASVTETRLAHKLRVIEWAANQLEASDQRPTRTALLALIGGKPISGRVSQLSSAIDRALARLMGCCTALRDRVA